MPLPALAVPAILSRLKIKDFVIAGLVTALVVLATLSFGFSIWGIGPEGWKPKSERLQNEVDDLNDSIKEAEAFWQSEFDRIAKEYKDKAEEADENAAKAMEDANARAEHFIANNRVRCPAANASHSATGSAGGSTAENPDRSSADTELVGAGLIAVQEDDVRICTENTVRLQEARKWALEIQNAPAR